MNIFKCFFVLNGTLFGLVKYWHAKWSSTIRDKYAVAVKNQDGNLVGHVPKELSRLFHKFLDDFGELEAECIGNRLNALWAMMYIWESLRGNYLRRTLLMIST